MDEEEDQKPDHGDDGFNILTWPKRIRAGAIRVHLVVDGDPVSKQRPRFARYKSGHVYTPKTTREAENAIGWEIRRAHRDLMPDADSSFGVRLLFRSKGFQRRDLDNMCKLVFDACNGIVWKDDSQVSELIAHIFRGDRNPSTEFAIYTLPVRVHAPMAICELCKREYRTYGSWKNRRFCSRDCHRFGVRKGAFLKCGQCATVLYRAPYALPGVKQVYCSPECVTKATNVSLTCSNCQASFSRPRSLLKARMKHRFCSELCMADFRRKLVKKYAGGTCARCGGTTSKRKYQYCAACRVDLKIFRSPGAAKKATNDYVVQDGTS